MKQKILAIFISVLMLCPVLLGLQPVVSAQENSTVWDGAADTSWYQKGQTSFTLSTAQELAGLSALTWQGVSFEGVDITLVADIDLAGIEWTPIGESAQSYQPDVVPFRGNFDGGGHIISNLKIRGDGGGTYGLFGFAIESTIENLGLENVDVNVIRSPGVEGEIDAGTLIGDINNGVVNNCYATGTLSVHTGHDCQSAIGGLVAYQYVSGTSYSTPIGMITNCYSAVDIISNSSDNTVDQNQVTGGVVGWNNAEQGGTALIENCFYTGTITDTHEGNEYANYIGGIAGANITWDRSEDTPSAAVIRNSFVSGSIVAPASDVTYIGNVTIQIFEGSNVENCYWDDSMEGEGIVSEGGTTNINDAAPVSPAEIVTPEFLQKLNQGQATAAWTFDANGKPALASTLTVIPADYSAVETAKAKVPADLSIYTEDTVNALNAALAAAVDGKKADEQSVVDGWAAAIEAAITALEKLPADYSKVNTAKDKVPENLDIYTESTVNALNAALAAVIDGKKIDEQSVVDGWAAAIEAAITALEKLPADYSKVDTAKDKVPGNLDIYTESTVNALNTALAAVIDGKKIDEQSVVDGWAATIEQAVAALEKLPADYSKVDTAKDKVPENLDIYTESTVNALNAALAAVIDGKKIDEQSVVDGWAAAIEQAVAALEKLPADYSKVDAAKDKVPENLDIYTESTVNALNAALAAVIDGKKIDEQSVVDGWAAAIEQAVAALEKLSADYSKVDTAKDKVPENLDIYTESTVNALNAALAAVIDGKKIDEQSVVDAWAAAIEQAVSNLTLKSTSTPGVSEPEPSQPGPSEKPAGTPGTGDAAYPLSIVLVSALACAAALALGRGKKQ